ncbi:hypothetical protein GCM10020000_33620 [Streptomyces olivoverticillatus]
MPQPLAYLVDDVARRHGHLRVGAASSYLRCDDEAVLAEILADRRSAPLRLRRLAGTVLAAQAAPDILLETLRAMGYAPAAESAEGDVLVTRADVRRTPQRTAPAPVPEGPPIPDSTLLGAAVRAIRVGDLAATAERKPPAEQLGHQRERPAAHHLGRHPRHRPGGRPDGRGRLDRLRQRRRRRQPARHRPDPGGGRLRDGLRPHGRRSAHLSPAPHHGRGGAGGRVGLTGVGRGTPRSPHVRAPGK